MTRPLRLEFAGALYHVTSRGDHSEAIFRDDVDRRAWLRTLQRVCQRCNFVIHAYCQMTNHYHVVVETVEGNLSQGMRQLNGHYTQHFNRRHRLVGHLFQGRYKAIVVQREGYLLELSRYVVLNPVRAGMVRSAEQWPWSSHRYLVGQEQAPEWLAAASMLSHFGATPLQAVIGYAQFVAAGAGLPSPLKKVSHQLLLGDAGFVDHHCDLIGRNMSTLTEVSKTQRRTVALSLAGYQELFSDPQQAMAQAYYSTVFTVAQIGAFFGVSQRSVSRAIVKFENRI